MEENKRTITLKNGEEVIVTSGRERLAGDVMIDFGGRQEPGILLGGGLSGDICITEAINKPVELPKGKEGEEVILKPDHLAGNVILRPDADNVLMTIINIRKIINNIISNNQYTGSLISQLQEQLAGLYRFNKEYIADETIDEIEKANDVKSVVDNNLQDIRSATIDFNNTLDNEQTKGL